MAGISDDVENLRVNRDDFLHALDEVHPAFGVSEEELEQVIQNGIIHFDPAVDVSLTSYSACCENTNLEYRISSDQVSYSSNKCVHQPAHL